MFQIYRNLKLDQQWHLCSKSGKHAGIERCPSAITLPCRKLYQNMTNPHLQQKLLKPDSWFTTGAEDKSPEFNMKPTVLY